MLKGVSMIVSSSEELANVVKSEREKRGISQRDLARSAGIGNATISCIENGTATNINVKTLFAISKALGINIIMD